VLNPHRELIPVFDDPVQDYAVGARHPQRDDDGNQHRQRQERDGARRDVVAVQGGNGFRVDELLPGDKGYKLYVQNEAAN